MELIYAAKCLSSTSFLFFVGSYIALIFRMEVEIFPAFALIVLGSFICGMVDMKIKPSLRFIPLILVFASLYWARDLATGLTIGLSVLVSVIMISKQAYFLTYGEGADEFKRNIKIIVFFLVFSAAFGITNLLGSSVLPYVIVYMISGVSELSMLRHNDETLKEKRFRILNTSILGGTCLLGFFMATDYFMQLCMMIIKAFGKYIFGPVMMAITTVSSYILLGFTSFLEDTVFELLKSKNGKGLTFENLSGLVDDNKFTGERPVLDVVFSVVVTIIIIVIIIAVIRKAFKGSRGRSTRPAGETRTVERIPRVNYDKDLSSEIKGIRNIYRKFLNLLISRGIDIPHYFTTEDVNGQITHEIPDKQLAEDLREYYIRARYGEKELTKEDLAKAKQLYANMKKKK